MTLNPYKKSDLEMILDQISSQKLTLVEALQYLNKARKSDITESFEAAEIRDAIRDNYNWKG